MEKNSKILVTGCQGMVGSSLVKELTKQGFDNVTAIDRVDCNLLIQKDVFELFDWEEPEYVFHIAARVGGIGINDNKSGEFIYENLMIQCNVLEAARVYNVKKLLFCGSACIYPKTAEQPIREESFLTGPLEQTNIGYAIAKISGVVMTQMYRKQYGCNFISAMPTNIYGKGDNFNLESAHVIPALIHKFNNAKIDNKPFIEMWGVPETSREFIYSEDLANGFVFLMQNYDGYDPINIGSGETVSIEILTEILKEVSGYKGEIKWNTNLQGVTRRSLDSTKINSLGWSAKTSLKEGIEKSYRWFVDNYQFARK
jgi:GDP-L-fucose synthase